MMDNEKPPIGIMSRHIWYYQVEKRRLEDISFAISEYAKAKLEISKDWIEEYNQIRARIEEYDNDTSK